MVDAEKPKLNQDADSLNPSEKTEGGDTQSSAEKEDQPTVKPTEKQPESFDDLEEQEYSEEEYQRFVELYDRTLSDISAGQIVMGRILAINENDVLIDIGFKSEGSVPIEEFGDPPDAKVGDQVEVFLENIEDADGQLILSKRKATFVRLWDKVVDIHNEGGTIEGVCVRRIKGGIVVDLNGVDAFLPGSQIDVKPIRDFDALIGKTFTFKIVKVNKLRKNIVVSRRVLLEESMAEERGKVLQELEKGQVRKGYVKNITDFGVFVDLGGVDGLLHINDLSWGRINHPSEVVKLDEEIEVVILDFNDAKDRISLGMKQLQSHPWEGIEEKYPVEGVVKGKVVSIADYGAFVELEKGVEGLIHVSEMSWTRHGIHPSKIVNVGEEVEVKVLHLDKERRRISLGLKQMTPDPWEGIEEKYPLGSKYMGRVRNMTNFGAFVEMEEGIDGLIHISDLSWTRKIKHPSEILKKGEEVEVIILDVNKKERRVSLGYKQLTDDPWPSFEEAYQVDTITKAKIVRFVDKGVIVELPLGLEGFVPLSQMVETSLAKVKQSVKVDDELEFIIIEFDKENKRVVLSQKKITQSKDDKAKADEEADVKAFMEKQDEAPTLGEIAGQEEEPEAAKDDKKKDQRKAESKKEDAEKKEEPAAEEKEAPAEAAAAPVVESTAPDAGPQTDNASEAESKGYDSETELEGSDSETEDSVPETEDSVPETEAKESESEEEKKEDEGSDEKEDEKAS